LLEERASELEQFSGRIAHDILSPLTAVSIALRLGCGPNQEKQSTARSLARGTNALERIQSLVYGLLEFARAGAKPDPKGRSEVEPILSNLAGALESDAAAVGAELKVAVSGTSVVACNSGVLTSLISNLAQNAIKYIGGGPIQRVEIRAFERGDFVRFEVEDTGPGLPPGLEEHVFEPYVQGPRATQGGIGLGLATVKRLVEAHRGTLGLRSVPGQGCVFWFELPKAREVAQESLASARCLKSVA
jgi:signal transduction histidine kinase